MALLVLNACGAAGMSRVCCTADGVSAWHLQGQMLGGSTIRISWGRSSTSRASANAAAAAAAAPAAFGGLFAGTGAGGFGTNSFGASTLPNGYGAAAAFGGAAPTATSDPYSAYYTALAQSDTAAFQVLWLSLSNSC